MQPEDNGKKRSGRRGGLKGAIGFALMLLLLYAGNALGLIEWDINDLYATPTPAPVVDAVDDAGLRVSFIDVGQGDSTLIVCDGEAMLIDAGLVSEGATVASYLDSCGVTELSYMVCTHAHEDHCGGLDDVVAAYPVETLFAPYTEFDASGAFTYFERAASKAGLDITVPPLGGVFTLGSAAFQFVAPLSESDDLNDTSLVIRLDYGDVSFLFTGDAGCGVLEDAAALGGYSIDCEVLKLGHHGSVTSTNARVLELTTPIYAVASCGLDNRYGHPHDETVELLQKAGIPLLRTDELGTITFYSDGKEVYYVAEMQAFRREG